MSENNTNDHYFQTELNELVEREHKRIDEPTDENKSKVEAGAGDGK